MSRLFVIAAFYPMLSGFVLLSAEKATLPVTPAQPNVTFYWDANGEAPEIDEKDKYRGGAYQTLDDLALTRQLLVDAMDMWNSVPGAYVTLVLTEADADHRTQEDRTDKQNSVIVEDSTNLSSAAYAQPEIPDDGSRQIVDCDITVAKKKTTAKQLAFTLTHELGHCLGLGHAHTNYNAIMGYSRTRSDLSLGADDIAGVVYLYPDPKYGDGTPKELAACGTIDGREATATAGAWLMLLGLTAPLMLARRPRLARAAPAKRA